MQNSSDLCSLVSVMRRWPVRESRLTAAARGCLRPRRDWCDLAQDQPGSIRDNLCEASRRLCCTASLPSREVLGRLARLYTGTELVHGRTCSGYNLSGNRLASSGSLNVPASVWTSHCLGQRRTLLCTPQHRRYFDEDFAAPASEGERKGKISTKPREKILRRFSKVKEAPMTRGDVPDPGLSTDTLRSIALAKQLLRRDQDSPDDQSPSCREASWKHDKGVRPTNWDDVAASRGRVPSVSTSSADTQDESQCFDSHVAPDSVVGSEFRLPAHQSSDHESHLESVHRFHGADSRHNRDSSAQFPPAETIASAWPSLSFSPDGESSHYSHELQESSHYSSSFTPTESSSFTSTDSSSFTPIESDSGVSNPFRDSSNTSLNLTEEDNLEYSSNPHRFSPSNDFLPVVANASHMAAAACTAQELAAVLQETVASPADSRVLKVAVLGLPNAGKSSIINALTQNQVCSASRKVHTTRSVARAAVTIGRTQLVFLDTPGAVTSDAAKKHKLPPLLVRGYEEALVEADLVLVVVDSACRYAKLGLHSCLLRILALHPSTPAVLCVNKVDLVQAKTSLLELAKEFTEGKVAGVSSQTDNRFLPPAKRREPFSSRNKTHQELVDEFLDDLEEQKNKRENCQKALQADGDTLMLNSAVGSNGVLVGDHFGDTPLDSEKPVSPENNLLTSPEEQEEEPAVDEKSIEELMSCLYNDETSSNDMLVKHVDSPKEVFKVGETEVAMSDTMQDERSLSLAPAQASSSIIPLNEAAELTFSVSFEELAANDHLYVAPALGSALEAYRPPLPFTEEEVFQGRVKLSEHQARDFVKYKKGWPLFQEVVFASTRSNKGIDPLRDLLMRRAKPGNWVYPPSLSTDQDPRQLAVAAVRGKFMERLKFHIPYELQYAVERWELGGGEMLHIGVLISCRKDAVARVVVGTRGCNIIGVAKDAEAELMKVFKKDVHLHLRVSSEESERRALDTDKERKLVDKGHSPEAALLLVKGVPLDRVKKRARTLKHKGAVYDKSVGLVLKKKGELKAVPIE